MREAQPLRRTDAGISCVVVGRNTTAGMPPSSALSLPVSAAPARQLSRANRPCKRKSSSGELLLCSSAALANVAYKTDGSYVNRPFFRSGRDERESIFSQINQLSRNVFCFFSSRKENVPLQEKKSFPLLFFEKEKKKPCLGFLLLTILDRFSACVVRYGCSAWLSLQRRAEERRCGRA